MPVVGLLVPVLVPEPPSVLLGRLLNVCPYALRIIELKLDNDVDGLQQVAVWFHQDSIEMLPPLDADDVPRLLPHGRF